MPNWRRARSISTRSGMACLPWASLIRGSVGGDLPLDIRVRVKVDELRSNGVIARGVVLSLGQDPVCE